MAKIGGKREFPAPAKCKVAVHDMQTSSPLIDFETTNVKCALKSRASLEQTWFFDPIEIERCESFVPNQTIRHL